MFSLSMDAVKLQFAECKQASLIAVGPAVRVLVLNIQNYKQGKIEKYTAPKQSTFL